MSARFINSGGMNCVLVYNTVGTGITSCVHASRDERELDEEGRRTGGRKVDSDIIGVERMSVSVAEREQIKKQSTRVEMGHLPAEDTTTSSLVDRSLGIYSGVRPTSTNAGV